MVKDATKSENETKIKYCISKLHYFIENKEKFESSSLNSVLDDLITIRSTDVSKEVSTRVPVTLLVYFRTPCKLVLFFFSQDKLVCIQLCCALVTPSNTILAGKCSQVVLRFIEGEHLIEQMACFIIQWCIQAVIKSPDISQTELLAVLEHVLKASTDVHKQVNNHCTVQVSLVLARRVY